MELELDSNLAQKLVTVLCAFSQIAGQVSFCMKSKSLLLSCINSSLSTLCIVTIESSNFQKYLRNSPLTPSVSSVAFRISTERLIAALRPKSREVATGATIQFGEPYIVICASYDSDLQFVTKIISEKCQFMFASHPSLDSYPVQMRIPALTLSAYLKSLSTSASPCSNGSIQFTFYHPNRCILSNPEGNTTARACIDPSDISGVEVKSGSSVLLNRQDLLILCGIRSKLAANLLLEFHVSSANVPVAIMTHLDVGIELKCIISSIEASPVEVPPELSQEEGRVDASKDSYIPASCSDFEELDSDHCFSIPGTPLEAY